MTTPTLSGELRLFYTKACMAFRRQTWPREALRNAEAVMLGAIQCAQAQRKNETACIEQACTVAFQNWGLKLL